MTEDQALEALQALAEPTRLALMRRLVRLGSAGAPAGELARAVGASPSRASFHLAALEKAGLVTHARAARQVIYRADFSGMNGLMAFLWEECCAACDPPDR